MLKKVAGSACAKRFAAAAGAAGFPLLKKAAGFGCAKRFAAAGAASFPLLKKVAGSACAKRFAAAGAAGFSLFKEAVGSASAKRFAQAAGAAGFPLFKRLPVLPARRDSRRRPAQQASRCSKGCRFCLREEIHGGGRRSRLPVVQKAAGSACAKRFTAGAGAAGFPLLKRLPVSAARRDSRRRLAQQASHC